MALESVDRCEVGDMVWRLGDDAISSPVAIGDRDDCRLDGLVAQPAGRVVGTYFGADLDEVSHGWVEAYSCSEFDPEGTPEIFPAMFDPGSRRWSAAVPAGCLDLRVRLQDFTPKSWPDLRIRAGLAEELQSFELTRSPRLLVRTRDFDTFQGIEGVQLSVVRTAPTSEQQTATQKSGRGGWAAFDLPIAGEFTISASMPGHRLEDERTIEAATGEEVVVEPLDLRRVGSVTVQLVTIPAAEARPRIMIELARIEDGLESQDLLRRAADESAAVVFEPLFAGEFVVRVLAGSRPEREAELYSEVGSLLPGEHRVITIDFDDDIREGRLEGVGEDLTTELRFQPLASPRPEHSRSSSRRTRTHSDGTFSVLLAPGRYRVRGTPIGRDESPWTIRQLEVGPEDDFLELSPPTARLHGVVEDEAGRPAKAARVTCKGFSSQVMDRHPILVEVATDRDGRFACEGLATGRWVVVGSRGDLASRQEEVWLTKAGQEEIVDLELVAGPVVRLQLELPRSFVGRAAEVMGFPVLESGSADVSPVVARPDGRGWLELRLPPGARGLQVQVFVEDGPADARLLPAPYEGSLRINEPGQPIDLDETWSSDSHAVLVRRDGGGLLPLVDLAMMKHLRRYTERGRQRIRISGLAAGDWLLLLVDDLSALDHLVRGELVGAPLAVLSIRSGEPSNGSAAPRSE